MLAGSDAMRAHCMDQEDMETLPWEWNLRSFASEAQFLKMRHAANLKQWKETLVLRYFIKIINPKWQSEHTKDRQEMPSIRLWKNVQEMTCLWWCKNFKGFCIDMKDEWKKMNEEWRKWLDPKHETCYVVKEYTCCMNIKFFFKQEKENQSSWQARCSRSCCLSL